METHPKNQNEQQKATKSIFHSQFHSFASTLDLWKVVDIKSKKKLERATAGNEKQMKSSKKLRRALKSNNGYHSWKNQNEQQKAKRSKWKPGLTGTTSLKVHPKQRRINHVITILPNPKSFATHTK